MMILLPSMINPLSPIAHLFLKPRAHIILLRLLCRHHDQIPNHQLRRLAYHGVSQPALATRVLLLHDCVHRRSREPRGDDFRALGAQPW